MFTREMKRFETEVMTRSIPSRLAFPRERLAPMSSMCFLLIEQC